MKNKINEKLDVFPAVKKGIFVIGFRKSGTTTVFDILNKMSGNPDVRIKEPQFFGLDENMIKEHFHWYLTKMEHGEHVLDGSTLYIHIPDLRSRISKYVKDVRFIVCLRDPAQRFFSAYQHMYSKGKADRRSLDDILKELQSGISDLVKAEKESIQEAKRIGLIKGTYFDKNYHRKYFNAPFDTSFPDFDVFYKYYLESSYHRFMDTYINSDDTLIIIFEKLLQQPEAEIKRLASFTGLTISRDVILGLPENRNKTRMESVLLSKLRENNLSRRLKFMFSESLITKIKNVLSSDLPKLEIRQKKILEKLFSEEYDYWFNLDPSLQNYWKR